METKFDTACDFFRNGKFKKAIELYRESIEEKESLGENCSEEFYNIGVCYLKLKYYRKSLENLNIALSMRKENKFYFNKGYCYYYLKDFKKALLNFQLAWCYDNKDNDCRMIINRILKEKITQ